jgi:hypothetical protein
LTFFFHPFHTHSQSRRSRNTGFFALPLTLAASLVLFLFIRDQRGFGAGPFYGAKIITSWSSAAGDLGLGSTSASVIGLFLAHRSISMTCAGRRMARRPGGASRSGCRRHYPARAPFCNRRTLRILSMLRSSVHEPQSGVAPTTICTTHFARIHLKGDSLPSPQTMPPIHGELGVLHHCIN